MYLLYLEIPSFIPIKDKSKTTVPCIYYL
jgi:hypothetical protein